MESRKWNNRYYVHLKVKTNEFDREMECFRGVGPATGRTNEHGVELLTIMPRRMAKLSVDKQVGGKAGLHGTFCRQSCMIMPDLSSQTLHVDGKFDRLV